MKLAQASNRSRWRAFNLELKASVSSKSLESEKSTYTKTFWFLILVLFFFIDLLSMDHLELQAQWVFFNIYFARAFG